MTLRVCLIRQDHHRFSEDLIRNENFRTAFITRFSDLLNSNFTPETVTPIITRFKSAIENEIPRHTSRYPASAKNWVSQVDVLYEFAEKRPPYVRQHLIDHFGLEGTYTLNVLPSVEGEGFIKVNTVEIKNPPWKGIYFTNLLVELTAIPKPGYLFAGWSDESFGMANPVKIINSEDFNISAKFIKNDIPENSIIINEINYKSSPDINCEDWVELYNDSDSIINLSGCKFSDSDSTHLYEIPLNSILSPKGYLVLCRKKDSFSSIFPNIKNVIGDLNFGLDSKGEKIILRTPAGIVIDSLTYDNKGEWSQLADGEGYTLELKNSKLDNSLAGSWTSSKIKGGTPGEINSVNEPDINNYPKEFTLYQNYPNPFNAGTTIRYSIPTTGIVKLMIYNILGQKVVEVDNIQNQPGYGIFQLNSTLLTSGVYFYQIKSGDHIETKKMILLR